MELPIYEFIIDDKGEHFTTALVKDPAVEKTLMYFNKEKPVFFANEEKRIIYSVAMRPNKMIFRKATDEVPEHNGYFSAESIEKFQQNYSKFKGSDKTNINHSDFAIQGVYPIENWIVKDSEMDKSKAIGLETQNGDLVMAFKVENDQVWEQCKNGDIDGLSIEAHLDRRLVSNFKIETMNKNTNPQKLWSAMRSFFAADMPEDEMMKDDKEKMAEHDDEEKMNEHVDKEKMAEHDDKEKMVEHEDVELPKTDHAADMDRMNAKLAELEVKLADMAADKVKNETTLTSMKSELEKFKLKTPASKSIVNLPKETTKTYSEMSNFEKMKFNKQK
jgi:hypothetical protein